MLDCHVSEGEFPYIGKCCRKSRSMTGVVYEQTCRHCSVWTSLPDSTSLEIVHMFECSLLEYYRRIKE